MCRTRHHRTLLVILCILALLLVLAACGTNYGANRSPSSSGGNSPIQITATAPHPSTGSSPTPPSTVPPTSVQGMPNGCPSDLTMTTPPPAATVILTTTANKRQAMIKKGDTIEVNLPFGQAWKGPLAFSQGILAMQSPSGYAFPAAKACVWRFIAVGTGTTTLSFTGSPICKGVHSCPQYILEIQFTIEIR